MTGQRRSGAAGRQTGRTGRPGQGVGAGPTRRRCAVYTRKSSEEGLEQEYNSLHAQREACEAYIRSQQHEGWTLVPTPYDDGGISGGTMERPALQALLAEVREGRVNIIVVYKVDRLTRSLADFAKMVELFDATGASFVAVTQQFNTTTSMGRLTLNVLLSFAQFEREVTGERIRDKIAASKRKGMWMGGRIPLGYDVQDRKLVVMSEDAARVVHLYRRYLDLGCVRALKAELDGQGIVSKPRQYSNGTEAGGTPYSRGALYALLSNPVYIGHVRHKGACHPGLHAAVVPEELYAAVQEKLASGNGGGKGRSLHGVAPSLLTGKLFDEAGGPLTPSHARKGERRYRYYVSAKLVADRAGEGGAAKSTSSHQGAELESDAHAHLIGSRSGRSGWRLSAPEVEQSVLAALLTILQDEAALTTDLLEAGLPASDVPVLLANARRLSSHAPAMLHLSTEAQGGLAAIVERVELSSGRMQLALQLPVPASTAGHSDHDGKLIISRSVPHRLQRRGRELRLVLGGGVEQTREDPALLKLVARAHCWFEDIVSGRVASAHELARQLNVSSRYVQRLLPLALLAPGMVERIATGHQGPTLTADAVSGLGTLPLRWNEHADLLPR